MWQSKTQRFKFKGESGTGERVYINVVADCSCDGIIRPVTIRLEDGPAYEVERVLSVTRMHATKHDGAETRYYVRIGDGEHYLFFEDIEQNRQPRWFVMGD